MDRKRGLDIAKGIAIIFVIMGHSYSALNENLVLYYIESFHMPFFFIVSGILYKDGTKKSETFLSDFGNKVKKFLIPYFVFEFLN